MSVDEGCCYRISFSSAKRIGNRRPNESEILQSLQCVTQFRHVLCVARGDSPKLFDFLEEILDEVAPFVHFLVIGNVIDAAGIGRDDCQSAALVQRDTQSVAVESLVGDERAKRDATQQRLRTDAVVALTWQESEACEIAECVDEHHDLDGQAAAHPHLRQQPTASPRAHPNPRRCYRPSDPSPMLETRCQPVRRNPRWVHAVGRAASSFSSRI